MAHPADRTHYAKVTTQATYVDADLTDYPMSWNLALITDQTWWNNIKSDGGDLMVYTEAGERVAAELDNLDTVAKTGWVHWLSSPSASVNQQWRIWVGNASASQPAEDAAYGREAVWNSNYVVRMSLGETVNNDADGYLDSTSNDNDGTGGSMALTAPAGQFGLAQDFDGTNDYIEVADAASLDITSAITLQAWVNPDTSKTGIQNHYVIDKQNRYSLIIEDNETISFYSAGLSATLTQSTGSISLSTWSYLAATYDSGGGSNNLSIYIDDSSPETFTRTGSLPTDNNVLRLGMYSNSGGGGTVTWGMDGAIDEVRISNIVRAATWLSTEYNNQSAPGTFNVYGGVFSSHRNRIMCAA